MNVRDATPGDEPWLIETLDSLDSYDPGFRWYHYVVVTTDDGARVGLGRITEHDEETVELDRIHGLGERPTVARAHAARGLVKRALEDDFATIRAATDATRPFEAVGFRETEEGEPLEVAHGETAMQWVPPAEREDDETDAEEAAESDSADRQATAKADPEEKRSAEGDADEERSAEARQAEDSTATDDVSYKYDTDAATPTTGEARAKADESVSTDDTPEDDDSTAAAARRQGFDPDRVETKYDTEDKTRSATTKYDTGGGGGADSSGEEQSGEDERETKYDTDETDDSSNTKYSV